MTLTGGALPYVLASVALVVFVAVALGLPHVRRRRGQIVIRVVQTVLLNVLVLVLAGVLLNDQYAFYTSWSDLVGSDPVTTHQLSAGDASAGGHVEFRPAFSPHRGPLPPLPSPGQREQTFTVTGGVSGITGKVVVWLPAGYDPTAATTYPVIETLSGYPGTPASNFYAFRLKSIFNDLVVTQRLIRPPVIVMPQINTPSSIDTECVNSPHRGGLQTETWLAKDVPDWTVAHFRVDTVRSSWGVMGYSFGGYCAAMLGLNHPQVLGASMALMGYFRPEFEAGYDPLTRLGSYDLAAVARHHHPPVSMFLMASQDDPTAYPPLLSFLKCVRAPMSVTTQILTSGGHRDSTIPPVLPKMLTWLASAAPGFRVGS